MSGPARGWWQFEQGEGVRGVLSHPASRDLARAVCAELHVEPQRAAVWRALEGHDLLAACFARLLLLAYPQPLLLTEATDWPQYQAVWRPGRPHAQRWPGCWRVAEAVYPRAG